MPTSWQQAQVEAARRRASIATHKKKVSGLFKQAKALYAPGGEYMSGIEAQLTRGSKKAVATGMQGLAAAGLAGTSMMGGLGLKYEEDVAAPVRAQATTARLGALSGLLQAEASAELQMAPRFEPITFGGGGRGRGSSFTPTRTTSTRGPTTTRQPAATKLPTLSAFPGLAGATKKEPTGYKGVFFGADYYKRQQQQKTVSATKPFSDYYDVGGELGI